MKLLIKICHVGIIIMAICNLFFLKDLMDKNELAKQLIQNQKAELKKQKAVNAAVIKFAARVVEKIENNKY